MFTFSLLPYCPNIYLMPPPNPSIPPAPRGRGASGNPRNRFERSSWTPDPEEAGNPPQLATRYIEDASVSIISSNNSPDIGFDKSINPYRGCEHGCAYCYARPTHEYLGYSSGLDFESRIIVKPRAAALLEDALSSPRWRPEVLAMSGVTDPYQPVEARLEITRGCLEVLARYRNPVLIITKNFLVTRDIDLLAKMARKNLVRVAISVTSLDPGLTRRMEPRTSAPGRRIEAIRALASAGVSVGVFAAPLIPGINDEDMPAVIAAASEAGASFASYTILRLPHSVEEIFLQWLSREFPGRREKVLARLRSLRGGKLNRSEFGERMRGDGPWGEQIRGLFGIACRRAGLEKRPGQLSTEHFRRPGGCQLTFLDSLTD